MKVLSVSQAIVVVALSTMLMAGAPEPTEQGNEVHPSKWLLRPLVGVIVAVNDDRTLRIRVAAQVDELVHVSGKGMVAIGHHDEPIGTRVYRLAGVERETTPMRDPKELHQLREWLVGKEVRLQIGKPYSDDNAPEPVPAVLYFRGGEMQLNEQLIRRGLGQLWDDLPSAIGAYEWAKMVEAAQAAKGTP